MRRFLWLVCLLPLWAACSCDGGGSVSAKGMLKAEQLDFPGVFVGDRHPMNLTLRNEGRAVVHAWVQSVPHGYELFPSRENPAVIEPAGTLDVQVVFAPDEVGRFDGDLVLATSGAKNETLTVRITGEGLRRELDVQKELNFGVVPVGEKKTLPLPITSLSGGKLAITGVIRGGDATAFKLDGDKMEQTIEVEAGEEGFIDVTYEPTGASVHGASLRLSTCRGCEEYLVTLKGEGGHEKLMPNPPTLTFGTISPGRFQALELRLVNHGNMPVEVTRAEFDDGTDVGFKADLESVIGTVPVNSSTGLEVRFAPAADLVALGQKEGGLRFYGADDKLLFGVPLKAVAGGPDLSIQPQSIDFGIQALRVQTRRLVTITNVGNRAPARVEEIFVRGANSKFSFRSPKGLNFAIGDEPAVIEVFFQSDDIGTFEDALVIHTDDDDSRVVEVRLVGDAADIPPCNLKITPGQVRFGLVAAGGEYEREITIFNQGISECAVWDFHMDPAGATAFRLKETPEGSIVIGPQETLKLGLEFSPPATSVNQLLSSAIVFSHSTPDSEPMRIDVSGYPSSFQVEIIPNPIDFGPMPIGYNRSLSVSVINTGTSAVSVDRFEVVQPGVPASETRFKAVAGTPPAGVPGYANIPGSIGAGQRALIRTSYLAWMEGSESAELQVFLSGADVPLLVPMTAEGRDEECGDLCEAPQAVCPPDEVVIVNQPHPLPGDAFNAAGDVMSCHWRVLNKPYGSRELPSPSDNCVTVFTPDMVGEYVLEMAVTDEQGKFGRCETKLKAIPHGGLWVEMFWEKASDVDLHLLHPNKNPLVDSSWWTTDDCYYGGKNRPWDNGGDESASLDRDDVSNTGPENIRINRPVIGHRYAVGVHWYSNRSHTTTWVTTNIYCGGVLVGTDTFNLNHNKEFMFVGDIQNNGIAGCTWRPDGTRWTHN